MTLDNFLRGLGGNLRANRLAIVPLTLGLTALIAASSCTPYNPVRAEGPEEQGQLTAEATAEPDTPFIYTEPEETNGSELQEDPRIITPPSDPLGIIANRYNPVNSTNIGTLNLQGIIDYLCERTFRPFIGEVPPIILYDLAGLEEAKKNNSGRIDPYAQIPVTFIDDQEEFIRIANEGKLTINPNQTPAYGLWSYRPNDGKFTKYELYILSGSSVWDTIELITDEAFKAYVAIGNPKITQKGPENLVFIQEASVLPFIRAVLFALKEDGYDLISALRSSNSSGVSIRNLQNIFAQRNYRDYYPLASWVAAGELDLRGTKLIETLIERANGLATIEEELSMAFYIISVGDRHHFINASRTNPPNLETARTIITKRQVPGSQYDPRFRALNLSRADNVP